MNYLKKVYMQMPCLCNNLSVKEKNHKLELKKYKLALVPMYTFQSCHY